MLTVLSATMNTPGNQTSSKPTNERVELFPLPSSFHFRDGLSVSLSTLTLCSSLFITIVYWCMCSRKAGCWIPTRTGESVLHTWPGRLELSTRHWLRCIAVHRTKPPQLYEKKKQSSISHSENLFEDMWNEEWREVGGGKERTERRGGEERAGEKYAKQFSGLRGTLGT